MLFVSLRCVDLSSMLYLLFFSSDNYRGSREQFILLVMTYLQIFSVRDKFSFSKRTKVLSRCQECVENEVDSSSNSLYDMGE